MALPGAAPQAAAVAGTSDHDAVVGRLAVGYLGRQSVPLFAPLAGANEVDAPVIGIRYWLSDMLGIDAGIGFGLASGSQETPPAASTDDPGFYAFLLHGGVPLSLASAGHFSFLVVPELNIGFAGSSSDVMGVETSVSAFHLDVGARAGAEIHFGFIDVPQLSLQAGIGLRMDMTSTSSEVGGMDGPSTSNFALRTTTNGEPWAIFTNSISAFYYF